MRRTIYGKTKALVLDKENSILLDGINKMRQTICVPSTEKQKL